jgi:hypothetical protein
MEVRRESGERAPPGLSRRRRARLPVAARSHAARSSPALARHRASFRISRTAAYAFGCHHLRAVSGIQVGSDLPPRRACFAENTDLATTGVAFAAAIERI